MKNLIKKIDALLPQTQCGQCSYDGCLPYANAIAKNGEAINRCAPGGTKTLKALAELLDKDVEPLLGEIAKQEQQPMIAFIREEECIGCTKCIQACPIDAILGAAKQLHTVIMQECTGCGLCVAPCPVDCIDMLSLETPTYNPKKARQRFNAKKERLEKNKLRIAQNQRNEALSKQRAYIEAAVARKTNNKKLKVFTKL